MNSTAITTAILFTNKYLRACISNRNGNDSKIKVNSLCTFGLQAPKQPEHPFRRNHSHQKGHFYENVR